MTAHGAGCPHIESPARRIVSLCSLMPDRQLLANLLATWQNRLAARETKKSRGEHLFSPLWVESCSDRKQAQRLQAHTINLHGRSKAYSDTYLSTSACLEPSRCLIHPAIADSAVEEAVKSAN